MIVLITLLSALAIIFCGASVLTLSLQWGEYRKFFDSVNGMHFRDRGSRVHGYVEEPDETEYGLVLSNEQAIVFKENEDFKVGTNTYLRNNFITWLDPYSLFWYLKYRDKFEKNEAI